MWYRQIAAVVLGVAVTLPAVAEGPQQGPAFTDPGAMVEMPAAWRAQRVSYEKWADGADLAVTLDQHLYPALLPLIREYARGHGLDIAVQEGTCGISAGKLEEKHADIGGFCCPAGHTDRLPGLTYHTLAIASLAVLVHPENPVENLSMGEARRLFSGAVPYWSDVRPLSGPAGTHERVRPVGRLHCKARPGHWRLLLDNEDQFSPRLREVSTIPDMINGVAAARGAVGYETLWMVRQHEKIGKVKSLRVGGVAPQDDERLIRGEYPLYRTYQITTWEGAAANPVADELVAFLKANMERVEPRYGLVPASRLRDAGWVFRGDELIGEPGALAGGEFEPLSWREEMALRLGRSQIDLCGLPPRLAVR